MRKIDERLVHDNPNMPAILAFLTQMQTAHALYSALSGNVQLKNANIASVLNHFICAIYIFTYKIVHIIRHIQNIVQAFI